MEQLELPFAPNTVINEQCKDCHNSFTNKTSSPKGCDHE